MGIFLGVGHSHLVELPVCWEGESRPASAETQLQREGYSVVNVAPYWPVTLREGRGEGRAICLARLDKSQLGTKLSRCCPGGKQTRTESLPPQ